MRCVGDREEAILFNLNAKRLNHTHTHIDGGGKRKWNTLTSATN